MSAQAAVLVAGVVPTPAVRTLPTPELAVSGLAKGFDRGTPVFSDVSFNLAPGQSVSLIGPNGAGKSTVLRCCVRLIEPDHGSVRLFETEVCSLGYAALRTLRAKVGFVFQRHNLVPRLSVLTNVIHGAQARHTGPGTWFHGLAPRRLREEALHCLDLVGLADLAGRRADHLSGGQSQRVAIARALMQRPRIVFADEPVASLDPNAGEEVMGLFVDLIRRHGLSLLFTSHNLRHAIDYSDRLLGLRQGRLQLDAPSARQDVETLRAFYA